MKGFFLDIFDNKEIELRDLEPYFINYNKDNWKYSNSGILSFGNDIKLYFINHIELGFSFRYDVKDKSFYSIEKMEKMNEFVDAGDDEFVPLGSCVTIDTAWVIIKDFFSNPQTKSNIISWLDEDKIDWSKCEEMW